jgi:hypothetical protein
MLSEKLVNFFKKNGVLLIQIAVLCLPIVILLEYATLNDTADVDLEKIETLEPVKKADSPVNEKKDNDTPSNNTPSSFEIDEVSSQNMMDKNAGNPAEKMMKNNASCANAENVHTVAEYIGTISKAKNIEHFKKPLPAKITETEYTCTDANGAKKVKSTTMGVAMDAEADMLRCIQSNSDEAMDREARFKRVLKIMTHHCGFKLSEPSTNAKINVQ